MNYSYEYIYDNSGNMTAKKRYAFTTGTLGAVQYTYSYQYEDSSWGDLLSSYNGLDIGYDEIGNPTRIVTSDFSIPGEYTEQYGYVYEWNGRQLLNRRSFENCGDYDMVYDDPVSFTYNADGIRTSKTVNGHRYNYLLNGSQIIGETWSLSSTEYRLLYIYDETGSPIGIQYRTSAYATGTFDYFFFEKNLQGDIVAVYNANGRKIGSYVYDAWGNFSITTTSTNTALENSIVRDYNPFRYRGYYYDKDLGWYYLQSRYYNPQWGRFVNADNVIAGAGGSIHGYNVFAYSFNNPINMLDSTGNWPQWMKNAANWVNNNIIQPVANFFSPSTNTISGQFQEGIFRGSGSLTGGYSEFNWRLDDKIKSSGSQDVWIGGFGKASVGNANGKVGIGNDNISASLKGVADGLVASAQAGLHYKDGFGVGAKAKASVLSGRATTEFNIFGWQVELGVCGELLSIGAEATIGIFPTESGGKEFRMKGGVAPGPYGWGYVVRIKSPY